MEFVCQLCKNRFVSKYNLRRHMERKHDSWPISSTENEEESENEVENSESEEEERNDTGESDQSLNCKDNESEDNDNENDDDDSEDVFTFDEVQAIVRYSLQEEEE